jgi:hypothetical protein
MLLQHSDVSIWERSNFSKLGALNLGKVPEISGCRFEMAYFSARHLISREFCPPTLIRTSSSSEPRQELYFDRNVERICRTEFRGLYLAHKPPKQLINLTYLLQASNKSRHVLCDFFTRNPGTFKEILSSGPKNVQGSYILYRGVRIVSTDFNLSFNPDCLK